MSKIAVTVDGQAYEIEVTLPPTNETNFNVIVDGQTVPVSVSSLAGIDALDWIITDNGPYEITVDRDLQWIRSYRGRHTVEVRDLEVTTSRPMSRDGRVKAPVPGLITRVLVQQGDKVEGGQPILVLEAMKMENEIKAPRNGTVLQLNTQPGKTVTLGDVLAEIG
ncbi:MAG: biotin/lipoyl-containing protein [Anaerolineae bacterium]